jgi:hypothetical protein
VLIGETTHELSDHCRHALELLPAEVNATYEEAIDRIVGQVEFTRELSKRVLAWIIYARQPPSLKELQHALAISSERTDMDYARTNCHFCMCRLGRY